MKLHDKKAIQEQSAIELRKQVLALKKEFAVAKMQFKVGKLPNPKLLSTLRKKIALMLTVVTEKEIV